MAEARQVDCAQFDSLLAEGAEDRLSEAAMRSLQAHAQSCAVCGPIFAETRAGLNWLRALEDVEPPRNLVRNILIATSGAEAVEPAAAVGRPRPGRLSAWLAVVLAPARRPRFAMAVATVFCCVTLMLNILGVRVSSLRHIDLRPSAIGRSTLRAYYSTTGKVSKYYDNLRLVYEIQSQVRDLQEMATPQRSEPTPQTPKPRNKKEKDSSGRPEQKRNQNYSGGMGPILQASAPTKSRRLVFGSGKTT